MESIIIIIIIAIRPFSLTKRPNFSDGRYLTESSAYRASQPMNNKFCFNEVVVVAFVVIPIEIDSNRKKLFSTVSLVLLCC